MDEDDTMDWRSFVLTLLTVLTVVVLFLWPWYVGAREIATHFRWQP